MRLSPIRRSYCSGTLTGGPLLYDDLKIDKCGYVTFQDERVTALVKYHHPARAVHPLSLQFDAHPLR